MTFGSYSADVATTGVQNLDWAGTSDTYDALNPDGRRKSTSGRVAHESTTLNANRRERVEANANDLFRNATLFGWALRRHLDYNTLFDFHPCNDDPGLNRELAELMERDNRASNCDSGGRHSWERMRRLAEVRTYLAGDVGLHTLRTGRLQGIESHWIRNPRKFKSRDERRQWRNGVKLGPGNRAVGYNVRGQDRRTGHPTDKFVPARRMFLHGKFEGRFDQVRGISPITSSLNEHRDIYETLDDTRAKFKAEKALALIFYRAAGGEDGDELGNGIGTFTGQSETGVARPCEEPTEREVDFGGGPTVFDLDNTPGTRAEFINADLPGSNAQDFVRLCISIAIKALDLPYNFFDEAHTNFFGSRAAWIQYERSCESKRADQLELHRKYTIWRMRRWMLPTSLGGTAELILPRSMSGISDLKWEWVPRGVPWWKPSEELDSELRACAAGLDQLDRVARRHGLGDVKQNIAANNELLKYAAEVGYPITWGRAFEDPYGEQGEPQGSRNA